MSDVDFEICCCFLDDAEFEQKQKVENLNDATEEKSFDDFENDPQEYENGFRLTPNEQKMMDQLESEMEVLFRKLKIVYAHHLLTLL